MLIAKVLKPLCEECLKLKGKLLWYHVWSIYVCLVEGVQTDLGKISSILNWLPHALTQKELRLCHLT